MWRHISLDNSQLEVLVTHCRQVCFGFHDEHDRRKSVIWLQWQ